jgi:Gpi18-like mannosyltransferase
MNLVERWRALDPAWRFALQAYLIARVALSVWAFIIATLFPVVAQNLDLFGAPVLAVFDLASGERYAYSREVGGAVLTFRAGEPGVVADAQTGSVWALRDGRAVSGAYAGRALRAAPYSAEDIFPYRGVAAETNVLLAVWQRFDTNWYLAIAERGYGTFVGDVHFPPLYPLLIRSLGSVVRNNYLAALILSNVALLIALAVFYRCVTETWGVAIARRGGALLLIFPTAFFFFSGYTESLFLLAALLALCALQRCNWLWAGFWIFCAILTRLQGVALLVPLGYALWRARPFDQKIERGLALILPILAAVLYLFIRASVGDDSIVPIAESNLHARLAPPWENYWYAIQTLASGKFNIADGLNWLITTLCVVMLLMGWRRLPILLGLYTASSLVVLTMRYVETQPLNSMSRYTVTLFPIFVLLGIWSENTWVQRAIVYPCLALALYLCAQFVLWGWVA